MAQSNSVSTKQPIQSKTSDKSNQNKKSLKQQPNFSSSPDWVVKIFEDNPTKINNKSDNKALLTSDFFNNKQKNNTSINSTPNNQNQQTSKTDNSSSISKNDQKEQVNKPNSTQKDEEQFSKIDAGFEQEEESNEDEDEDFETDDSLEEAIIPEESDEDEQEKSQEDKNNNSSSASQTATDNESSVSQISKNQNPNQIFDYEFEKNFLRWYSKTNKHYYSIFFNFLNKQKQYFPFFSQKISLFDLFVLISMISQNKDVKDLYPTYSIYINLDKYRNPLFVSKFWSLKNSQYKITQNDITGECYLPDSKSADEAKQELIEILEIGNNQIYKKTTSNNKITGQHFDLVSLDNIFSFPTFSLTNGSKILNNFASIDWLLKSGFIKFVTTDTYKKPQWLLILKKVLKYCKKEFGDKYEVLSADEIYDIYSQSAQKNIRVFMPTNFDVSFKNKKIPKEHKLIYELIYTSWLRYCIRNLDCFQILEVFFLNMYEFKSDTIVVPVSSGYNYKNQLFDVDMNVFPEIPKSAFYAPSYSVLPKNISIHQNLNYKIDLQAVLDGLCSTQINLTKIDFLFKSVLNLIDCGFININQEFKISFNPFLTTYFNEFKKDSYQKLNKLIKSILNIYFSLSKDLSFYTFPADEKITSTEQYKLNTDKIQSLNKQLELLKKYL